MKKIICKDLSIFNIQKVDKKSIVKLIITRYTWNLKDTIFEWVLKNAPKVNTNFKVLDFKIAIKGCLEILN